MLFLCNETGSSGHSRVPCLCLNMKFILYAFQSLYSDKKMKYPFVSVLWQEAPRWQRCISHVFVFRQGMCVHCFFVGRVRCFEKCYDIDLRIVFEFRHFDYFSIILFVAFIPFCQILSKMPLTWNNISIFDNCFPSNLAANGMKYVYEIVNIIYMAATFNVLQRNRIMIVINTHHFINNDRTQ